MKRAVSACQDKTRLKTNVLNTSYGFSRNLSKARIITPEVGSRKNKKPATRVQRCEDW